MSGLGEFWYDEDGVRHYWQDREDGGFAISTSTDITAALEANQAAQSVNDGWSKSRELRRVAHIPNAIIQKWLSEGFDMFDKNNKAELLRRLDDPDWALLRTAPGRLGRGAGRMV